MCSYQKNSQGFTLIELAIVVVIIGLIIAGVTAGVSLVRSSHMRSVIAEVNRFESNIYAFRSQYGYFPGDIPNAFSYWGTDCAATAANCNGNGDNSIYGTGAKTWAGESLWAWKHLQLAGLISGQYSGTYSTNLKIGIDIPAAKLPRAGYHFAGNSGQKRIFLEIGAETGQDRACQNILSAPEASNIDIKMDDGVPTSGKVKGDVYGYADYRDFTMGGTWSGASCYSGNAYVLTNTARNSCRVGFLIKK